MTEPEPVLSTGGVPTDRPGRYGRQLVVPKARATLSRADPTGAGRVAGTAAVMHLSTSGGTSPSARKEQPCPR